MSILNDFFLFLVLNIDLWFLIHSFYELAFLLYVYLQKDIYVNLHFLYFFWPEKMHTHGILGQKSTIKEEEKMSQNTVNSENYDKQCIYYT